jgi:PST family polysaccharide transporter
MMARLLDPVDFGFVGLAMVAVLLADSLVISGGLSEFLIRKRDIDPAHIATLFWLQLAVAMVAMLLCIALAPMIAQLLGRSELGPLIRWFAFLLPLSALAAVPDALLKRALAFKRLALRSTLAVIIGGSCGIGLALNGFGVWSLFGFYLTQRIVEIAVLWLSQPVPVLLLPKMRLVREVATFGGYSTVSRVLQACDQIVMRTTAGVMIGPTTVGYIQLGRSVLDETTNLLVNPFTRVAMPAFASIQTDVARLQRVLRVSSETSAIIAYPSFLGIAVTAPDLVPFVFGRQWTDAVPIIQILSLSGLAYPISNLDVALMRGLGQVRVETLCACIASALLLLFAVPLSRFGLEALAGAILARTICIVPIQFLLAQKCSGVNRRSEAIACGRLLLPAIAMAAVVVGWRSLAAGELAADVRLFGSVLVGVVTYAALVLMFARGSLQRIVAILRRHAVTLPAEVDASVEPAVTPVPSNRFLS